jgi:hypothetical protein
MLITILRRELCACCAAPSATAIRATAASFMSLLSIRRIAVSSGSHDELARVVPICNYLIY